MGSLIYDLYHDEMRAGFLVTTDRKKIWNVELNLLVEVDRICQNHGITYFADYGTLLGAVRHQGFIPWDDDIDLVMLRPDYERFKEIAMNEIKTPLFFKILIQIHLYAHFLRYVIAGQLPLSSLRITR